METLEDRLLPTYGTSVSLLSSLPIAQYGQAVSLTANVSPTVANVQPPAAGTVNFFDGNTQIGSGTVRNGVATFTTTSLAVGVHSSITADYVPDAAEINTFSASGPSPALTETIQAAGGTSVTVFSSASTSFVGRSVTFTANVEPTFVSAFPVQSGTVTFYDGATTLGTGTVSNGVATFTTSSLSTGTHSAITAAYVPDAASQFDFNASAASAPLVETIVALTPDGTSVTVFSSAPTALLGRSVTFTAVVVPTTPTTAVPTGTVTFFDGSHSLGAGNVSNGIATLTTTTLSLGTHSAITASYSPNAASTGIFSASNPSPPLTETIGSSLPTVPLDRSIITISSSSPTANYGAPITFVAAITPATPTLAAPTGTVFFFDGSNILWAGAVTNGLATYTTSSLTVGTHSAITAAYYTDITSVFNFKPSGMSAPLTETIRPAAQTNVVVFSSLNDAPAGQSVTLTAIVRPSTSSTATITGGTVDFFDGAVSLGVGTVHNGVATFTTTSLSVGVHSAITAEYVPDSADSANFAASGLSPDYQQVVYGARPTVVAVSPANGATAISTGTSIVITLSGTIDPTTINSSTVQLLGPGNVVVPASVSFNPALDTVQLTPNSALAYSTTFTVSVSGGASGAVVKNDSGQSLAATFTSTFTTVVRPPVASAGPSESAPEGTAITFAGSVSYGTTPETYAWTFGDGGSASGSLTPSHTYEKAGTYTATLTVTDALGRTSQSSDTVTVSLVAPTVTTTIPSSGNAGTSLSFIGSATDPSTYDTQAGFTYHWNFGDGNTASTASASHTYASAGSYTVTLTVTDAEGAVGTSLTDITVNPPVPVANAGPNETANEGSPVTFAGSTTGGEGALGYSWSFGDGTTSTGSLTPTHVYANYGSYTATLTVTDGLGRSSISSSTVTIKDVAPTVNAGGPYSVVQGTAIALTASATDPSAQEVAAGFTYSWNFGDGTTASGRSAAVSHTYAATGTYTVTVTATDSAGEQGTATTNLTVASTGAQILTTSSTGYSMTGPWNYDSTNSGCFNAMPDSSVGPAVAQWQASITPGTYEVWAAWVNGGPRATNAPYTILDGTSVLATVQINQSVPPLGIQDGGMTWQELGVFSFQSNTMAVQLSNNANNYVLAEGIRFQADDGAPISPALAITGASNSGHSPVEVPVTLGSQVIAPGFSTVQYAWNVTKNGAPFATGTASSFTFTPDDNGAYVVMLTVTTPAGASATATQDLTIDPVPPTVTVASSFSGKADWATNFAATGADVSPEDAASLTYAWNFGDGTTGTGADPSHEYTTAGTYSVTVTVTDKNGSTASASTTANIASLGPAPSYIVTPYLNIPDFGYDPTIVSVQSGNWSNPATWSLDRVPVAGDIVDINPGTTVTYDENSTVALNTVEVKSGATLTFSTSANTQMYVVNLMVLQGGTLNIGTQASPIPASVTATVVWVNQAINTALDPEQYGNGLIVLGTFNSYGAVKASYVTLSQNANVGDTVLHLASPATGWQVGDKLQLPDTRELEPGDNVDGGDEGANYTPEWESMTIQSISADGLTITLTAPLQYSHLGGYNAAGVLEYLPQVVDMTRNVSIHSQSATGTRGYALFTGNANVSINYTAFTGMGRTTDATFDAGVSSNANFPQAFDNTTFDANGNVTHVGANEGNRNAITLLDLIGPASPQVDGYQYTFNGNVVTCPLTPMPFIWGINVVNSSYGLIQNNDVVNWAGAGIMSDYTSVYNNFTGNFVMRINGTGSRGSNDMGFGGDGFWLGNATNYVTYNIVTDLNAFGGYGYAYEIYASAAIGLLGDITIPAYQGANPSEPGQSETVDGGLLPILSFANDEAYGVVSIGMSFWNIDFPSYAGESPLLSGGSIKDFVTWNVFGTGIYGYEANNVTIDHFVCLGSPSILADGYGAVGMQFQDYFTGNMVIENADIEDQSIGIWAPDNTGGTQTIENSYLADQCGVSVNALWSVSFYAPPRDIVIDNVQFVAPLAGQLFTAIDMNWYAPFQLAGGVPILQQDQVFVYNYNGVSGDNFQVFYTQQAASFIVPQSVPSDGSTGPQPLSGSPVAGLTNAQTWAQYGFAIAGAVAPSNSTTVANIVGLVAPI